MVSETPKSIINYWIIFNAQYQYIVQLMHAIIINILNKVLLEKCYKHLSSTPSRSDEPTP
jgi:hypothetical protein